MDKTLRKSLLFDFYGPLLTQRQQDVFQMYFHDDLSLGEIGSQLGISRQGVYDILKRSGVSLEDFEAKLALVAKYQDNQESLREIKTSLESVRKRLIATSDPTSAAALQTIQKTIERILREE